MSGTGLDGVDAVVAEFDMAGRPHILHHLWQPYAEDIRQALLDLHHPGEHELERALRLSGTLAECHAGTTACLARQTLEAHPGSLAEATGARGARILGAIHTACKHEFMRAAAPTWA